MLDDIDMRDDESSKFYNYILGKKFRLLYHLYTRLYSFAQLNGCVNDKQYAYSLADEFDDCMLWIRGTENSSIDNRLKVHSLLYKRMKPQQTVMVVGNNGQYLLFEDLNDIK